ncbi:MAG: hypothetical protein AABW72_03100 [archaeon]
MAKGRSFTRRPGGPIRKGHKKTGGRTVRVGGTKPVRIVRPVVTTRERTEKPQLPNTLSAAFEMRGRTLEGTPKQRVYYAEADLHKGLQRAAKTHITPRDLINPKAVINWRVIGDSDFKRIGRTPYKHGSVVELFQWDKKLIGVVEQKGKTWVFHATHEFGWKENYYRLDAPVTIPLGEKSKYNTIMLMEPILIEKKR